jgi:hypothetical protein
LVRVGGASGGQHGGSLVFGTGSSSCIKQHRFDMPRRLNCGILFRRYVLREGVSLRAGAEAGEAEGADHQAYTSPGIHRHSSRHSRRIVGT